MKHILMMGWFAMLIGLSASASTTGGMHKCPGIQMPLGEVQGIPSPYRVTVRQETCPVDQFLFVQGLPTGVGVTYFYAEKGFFDVHMVGSVLYYDAQDVDGYCVTYWEDLARARE